MLRQIHLSKTIKNVHHDWRLKLFTHRFSNGRFVSHMDGPLKKVKLHLSKNECKSSGGFVSSDVCYKPAVHS